MFGLSFLVKKEEWISIKPNMDKELESLARCLRACELVGIESILQYFPRLVALQFGIDRDLPGCVF